MKNIFELFNAMKAVSPIDADVNAIQIDPETIELTWHIPKWRMYAEGIHTATGDFRYSRFVSLVEYCHIDNHLNDVKNNLRNAFEAVQS